MKVIYVAGKYRGANGWEVAENIRAAERVGYEVAKLGAMPLIPHANTAHFDGTKDDDFWIEGTLELQKRSDAVIMVHGWQSSVGAQGERNWALVNNMPVFYDLQELEGWLRAVHAN